MEINKLNEHLDMLIMETYVAHHDVNAMKLILEACPNCSVKYADVIDALESARGLMIDAMARLRAARIVKMEDTQEGGADCEAE